MNTYTLTHTDEGYTNPTPVTNYAGADAILLRLPNGPMSGLTLKSVEHTVNRLFPKAVKEVAQDGDIVALIEGVIPAAYYEALEAIEKSRTFSCAVDRKAFSKALAVVGKAIWGRATLPILHNVLLEMHDGTLSVSATDLELGIVVEMPAQGHNGRTTIPCKDLAAMIRTFKDDVLVFHADYMDHFTIRGSREASMHGLPADEYPVIPLCKVRKGTVKAADLSEVLKRCLVAASFDETRARLTGLNLIAENKRLRAVATDTHRLSMMDTPYAGKDFNCIVPHRALKLLPELVTGDVFLDVSDDQFGAEWRIGEMTVRFVNRQIEGVFPNYHKVIPGSADHKFHVNGLELKEALRTIALVVKENANKVVFDFVPGGIRLSAHSTKFGDAEATVWSDGDFGGQIAVNADYLIQGLHDEQYELWYTAANQPIALFGTHTYILMPMQLGQEEP